MQILKFILCLVFSLCFQEYYAFTQSKNPPPAHLQDLFDDLPIDDPSSRSILAADENGEEKIRNYISVNGFLNKKSCFVGEPVLLNYELFSALKSTSTIQHPPTFSGFQIIDMEIDNNFPKYRKKDGINYSHFIVKRSQLIPFTAGALEIGPIIINNEVTYVKNDKTFRYAGVATGQPVKLEVHALPEINRPDNFNGAVGNFKIITTVARDSFPAGDNNMLQVIIEGSGNFISLAAPAIYWPAGSRQFTISEKADINENLFPVQGRKIISIPFISEETGEYVLPPVEFPFFNPTSGKYVTSVSQPIRLVVTPGKMKVDPQTTVLPLENRRSANYLWLLVIPLLVGASALIFFTLRRRRVRMDVKAAEMEKEQAAAELIRQKQDKLRTSIAQLVTLEPSKNYIANFKQVLTAYLQDKLNTSESLDVMNSRIKVLDKATGEALHELLQECDMWLYAPISPDEDTRKKLVNAFDSIAQKLDQIYCDTNISNES